MDFTYNYNQMYQKETNYSDFSSSGSSYQSPYQVFLYEVFLFYLNGLAPYVLILKEFGIANEKIKEDYLDLMSSGILNVEFSQEKFFELITKLYDNILQIKETYISVCQKNNLEIKAFGPKLKDPKNLNFPDAIKLGQKLFKSKYTPLNPEQINFVGLCLNIIKSVIVHLIELRGLGAEDENAYYSLLTLSTYKNTYKPLMRKILMEMIKHLVMTDNRLLQKIYTAKKELYGEIEISDISVSTRVNKAILVSGSNLKDLELLLEATKDKGIDVYTHGYMLPAHAYPKFKTYPHLVGHFGEGVENYLLNFSEFPGSILLTKHSFLNVVNFYRGRIYTTDVIAPPGVVTLKDNDFTPLIESALRAEGFSEKIEKPPIRFNFSEKQLAQKVTEVTERMENGKVKHFFALEAANLPSKQKDYFNKFVTLLNENCFVLSFSCFDNHSYVELDYEFLLLYKSLETLTRKISIEQFNPIMLFTVCGEHMLSHIIYMKLIGIKKIYLPECPIDLFNPGVLKYTKEKFGIKNYTNPADDLKDMLGE